MIDSIAPLSFGASDDELVMQARDLVHVMMKDTTGTIDPDDFDIPEMVDSMCGMITELVDRLERRRG